MHSHRYFYTGTMSIKDIESGYNYEVVRPLISLAVKNATSSTVFRPGEILLDASDEDFKADGLVLVNGMEVLLLETSDPYSIKDNNRFGQDHVKGAFGSLKFLRKIIKTLHFATETIMRQLRVLFVHVRGKFPLFQFKYYTNIKKFLIGTKVHLWTLEMPSKDVQVLDHMVSVDVLLNNNQVDKILDLGNFVRKLNVS